MAQLLTELLVKELPAPNRGAVTVWDLRPKGFGVRVFAPTARHPEGARSFFINYRIDGVERRLTIGPFPEWSALAARKEAKDLRKKVDQGIDPVAEMRSRREAPTVKDLADRYKAEHLPKKAARSQKEDWSIIQREILPRLGQRKVADVHHGDIAALHRSITERGAPVRANRVLATISKMFSLSLKPAAGENAAWRDQAQGNPCRGVERNPEEGCERFFSTAEIAALSEALTAYGATPAADCMRLIMLTGCRPGEAMLATWDHFDTEPGVWVKPSSHTKQRRTHRVPLSPVALQLLDKIRKERKQSQRGKDNDFVFPGQKPGAPLKQLRSTWDWVSDFASVSVWAASADAQVSAAVAELEQGLGRRPTAVDCISEGARRGVRMGLGLTDARIYDLRHTFASIGAGGGLSLQIVGKLLGHTQHRTTMRYAHLADDPLREAVAKIGGVISGAGRPSAQVTPIKEAG